MVKAVWSKLLGHGDDELGKVGVVLDVGTEAGDLVDYLEGYYLERR